MKDVRNMSLHDICALAEMLTVPVVEISEDFAHPRDLTRGYRNVSDHAISLTVDWGMGPDTILLSPGQVIRFRAEPPIDREEDR